MTNALSDLANHYWWVGGIVASLMWLWGGRQYAAKSNALGAVSWQCIALVIIVIVGGLAFAEKQWGGAALATAVFALEMRELRRTLRLSQVHGR